MNLARERAIGIKVKFDTNGSFPCKVHYWFCSLTLTYKALDSNSTFNGPFKRAELLLLPQYAVSNDFSYTGKWTETKNHILSFNSGEGVQCSEPLYCIVVGTVSADKTYLGKHGNFSSKFNNDARKAKIQFTINHPDFGADYNKAIVAFQELQSVVSETPRHRYFLLKNEGDGMRMNYGLFEPKVRTCLCQFFSSTSNAVHYATPFLGNQGDSTGT